MTIVIAGFTSDDKVPGAYGETKYGQGRISIGSLAVLCLVMGSMLATGTATADTEVYDIPDADTAKDLFDARSEAAQMCNAALEVEGVTLKAIGLTEPAGVQATLAIQIGGAWTADGDLTVYLGAKPFSITVLSTDTVNDVATNLAAKIAEDADLFATAAAVTDTVTVTVANKGTRGNNWIGVKDLSTAPAGLTCTLTGGTALTGGATPFSGGTGTDDITTALATMDPDQYDRIACAADDATNADLLRDAVNSKAGPLKGLLEHFVFAKTRTLTAATSFSQTDLNEYRGQVYWLENCETPPSVISAEIAALRSVTEGANPNPSYDDYELKTVAPQRFKADWAGHAELKTALNNGVSPLRTTTDKKVQIVRAITAHSLNGAAADYRTLDVGDAVVPDRIRVEASVYWTTVFKVANPFVGPDPTDGKQPKAGTATPTNWNASLLSEVLRPAEDSDWIQDLDDNLPQSIYDSAGKRIMSAIPVVAKQHQHQIGLSVRQQAA